MSFSGSLFSIGGADFPLEYVFRESYKVTPHTLDLDSARTTQGLLQRNVLEHQSCTVSITTKPMWNTDFEKMWRFIRSKCNNMKEKKVSLSYYNPEKDDYDSGDFYIPDVEHNIGRIDNDKIFWMSETIEFIGY